MERSVATPTSQSHLHYVHIAPFNPFVLSSARNCPPIQNGYGLASRNEAPLPQTFNPSPPSALPVPTQKFTYSQATSVTGLDEVIKEKPVKTPSKGKRTTKKTSRGGAKSGSNSKSGKGNKSGSGSQQKKRTLTDNDMYEIIDYWEQNYSVYGKMGAKLFSKRVMEHFNRKWIPRTADNTPVTAEEVERKLKYMVERYRFVTDKMEASEFGNTEDDPASLHETKERLFKYYHDLHRFLGTKSNNVPALIAQFSQRDGETCDDLIRNYGGGRAEEGYNPTVENMTNGEEPVENEGDGNNENKEGGTGRESQENGGTNNANDDSNTGNTPNAEEANTAQGGNRSGQGRKRSSVFELDQDEDEDDVEPAKKKRRTSSQEIRKTNPQTHSRSNSAGDVDSKSASKGTQSRMALVEKLATNSSNFTRNAEKSFEKTVEVMMKDVELRSKEVKVMEKESEISQIKAQEHALREQAAMYKAWGEDEEAKDCMKEARARAKKLGQLYSK